VVDGVPDRVGQLPDQVFLGDLRPGWVRAQEETGALMRTPSHDADESWARAGCEKSDLGR